MDDWNSYEDLILETQESEMDDCTNCPYKGVGKCHNQCMEIIEVSIF